MNRGLMKFIIICFLFFFGLLFGVEFNKEKVPDPDVYRSHIASDQYISRIENGQFIYQPVHQSDHTIKQKLEEPNTSVQKTEKALPTKKEGPKMNKQGKLDQVGKNLGSKFSQMTRSALEKSFSFFTD